MKRHTSILMLISWVISLEIFFLIVKASGGAGWFFGLFRSGQPLPWIALGLASLGVHVAGHYICRALGGGVARGATYLHDRLRVSGRAPEVPFLTPGVVSILLVVSALGVMAASPAVRDDLQWFLAENRGSIEAIERYMAAWPDGRHFREASVVQEELIWGAASTSHRPRLIGEYIARFPQSDRLAEATAMLEQFSWEETQQTGTIAAFRGFLSSHPGSRFSEPAETSIRALLADDAPFLNAERAGTKEAYESFLASYPGHSRETQALANLSELAGADIADLLRQRTIEARFMGGGIRAVNVRVRRLVERSVTVRIPAGVFFSSAGAVQDMVASETATIVLDDGDWKELVVQACCADRGAEIPGAGDLFVVRSAPAGSDLTRLMGVLSGSNVTFATKQAAVWIVTDDASYSHLGTLLSGHFGGFGGVRAIGPNEAVGAMRLCSRAGIDIRRKAIWGDRQSLLDSVADQALKSWLQEKDRESVGT